MVWRNPWILSPTVVFFQRVTRPFRMRFFHPLNISCSARHDPASVQSFLFWVYFSFQSPCFEPGVSFLSRSRIPHFGTPPSQRYELISRISPLFRRGHVQTLDSLLRVPLCSPPTFPAFSQSFPYNSLSPPLIGRALPTRHLPPHPAPCTAPRAMDGSASYFQAFPLTFMFPYCFFLSEDRALLFQLVHAVKLAWLVETPLFFRSSSMGHL